MQRSNKPCHVCLLVVALSIAGCGSDSGEVTGVVGTQQPPVLVVDSDGNTTFNASNLSEALNQLPLGTIDAAEEDGLIFMREEEKLAHDVYTQLSALWAQDVFVNIASSELTHTQAVLALLERYGIPDPVGTNPVGVFVDPTLQGLHDVLVARGTASLIDALYVGAEIEEIDLVDIASRLNEVAGNDDIVLVYENLMKGSRNHLRAFVRVLESQFVTYEPQHLTLEEYDAVISSPTETGGSN